MTSTLECRRKVQSPARSGCGNDETTQQTTPSDVPIEVSDAQHTQRNPVYLQATAVYANLCKLEGARKLT